jgi:hypothetical protein
MTAATLIRAAFMTFAALALCYLALAIKRDMEP